MVVVISADNIENEVKICVIQIDLDTTITYTLYLYKSHPNGYKEYNFLVLLTNVTGKAIRICVIKRDLEKITTYTTCLYKFK